MFWTLLLAHFTADYPLQPNWLVRKKVHLWALGLHVSIHLAVMLVLVGNARALVWPYLVVLALIHFWIDVGKNLVYRLRPKWVVAPYLIDQACHYLSIGFLSAWIERHTAAMVLPLPTGWVVLAIGYLLVTDVWFITERILAHAQPGYRLELVQQLWPRLITRAALLSVLLLLWNWMPFVALVALSINRLPYLTGPYRWRALFTDLAVVVVVLLLVQWVS